MTCFPRKHRVRNADLTECESAGKFEKLLRSDPECLVWVVPGVSVV